jgi:hypothetical protein
MNTTNRNDSLRKKPTNFSPLTDVVLTLKSGDQ